MRYPVVLFDFDFTLVDASECLFAALRKGLSSIGAARPSDSQLKSLIGIPLAKQYGALFGNTDPCLFTTFKRVYVAERAAREVAGTHLLPGVVATVEQLNRDGYRLGVVSTGATGRIRRTLERLRLLTYFTDAGIVGGAENKADAIRHALSLINVGRDQTVYVGDRPDDAIAANESGVSFIGVTTGAFTKSTFAGDCIVIASLEHLADYV